MRSISLLVTISTFIVQPVMAKLNLNYFEHKLSIGATARNYKTMLKLISMTEENRPNL
ncbi:hypothetical protein [Winogradskyella sp.]|uniref:hypothetical protein n=1 Tax=Winogradskyella sp. TaxID=1883156 RepID=UPI003F6986F7